MSDFPGQKNPLGMESTPKSMPSLAEGPSQPGIADWPCQAESGGSSSEGVIVCGLRVQSV